MGPFVDVPHYIIKRNMRKEGKLETSSTDELSVEKQQTRSCMDSIPIVRQKKEKT